MTRSYHCGDPGTGALFYQRTGPQESIGLEETPALFFCLGLELGSGCLSGPNPFGEVDQIPGAGPAPRGECLPINRDVVGAIREVGGILDDPAPGEDTPGRRLLFPGLQDAWGLNTHSAHNRADTNNRRHNHPSHTTLSSAASAFDAEGVRRVVKTGHNGGFFRGRVYRIPIYLRVVLR